MGIKRTRYKDGNYTIEVAMVVGNGVTFLTTTRKSRKALQSKVVSSIATTRDFEEVKALINSGYVEFFEKNDAEKKREYWSLSEGERERQLDSIVCKYMDLYRTKQKELVNAYYERKFNNDDR